MRLTAEKMSAALAEAIDQGSVRREDTAVVFHDLSLLEARFRELQSCFPVGSLHAVAVKANPLPALLRRLCDLGAGAEAASAGELHLALRCGFPPERIVFDSPVKTEEELAEALRQGVMINADSFAELDRIERLRRAGDSRSRIGLRVNPQVGAGTIASTSVADQWSKFGVPIDEFEEDIIERYQAFPWLSGIHMHVGSQGCSMEQLVEAGRRLVALMERIGRPLNWVDIGGGLAVEYRADQPAAPMQAYAERLRSACPELFTGEKMLVTEFGRWMHANAGWTATRVEYVKPGSGIDTAMIHVGADQFIRRSYQPEHWHHDLSVADARGRLKPAGKKRRYAIAGPLCFAGDILAREIELPELEAGDFLLIHDTGAYTFGMWSRYNSRQMPRVLGYQGGEFSVLRERETLEQVYDFWS